MLVPSTRTGWYRKIMMNADTTTEITKSRSQECMTPLARPEDSPPDPLPSVGPICPSVSTLSQDLPYLDVPAMRQSTNHNHPAGSSRPVGAANQFTWAVILYTTGGSSNFSLASHETHPSRSDLFQSLSPLLYIGFRGFSGPSATPKWYCLQQTFLRAFHKL